MSTHLNFSGIRSSFDNITFPAIPDPYAARLHSTLCQMDQSQWWPSRVLQTFQHQQLSLLLSHAWNCSPGYRKRLKSSGYDPKRSLNVSVWDALPILTRADLQQSYTELCCSPVPQGHGKTFQVQSSGSTGQPIQALKSELSQFFWQTITLRDHLWHNRDFMQPMVGIRPDRQHNGDFQQFSSWGTPVDLLYHSGPSWVINSSTNIEQQLAYLAKLQPTYLITLPSNLRALIQTAPAPLGIPIHEVRTFGETVTQELRDLVRDRWDIPLNDIYSATEVGYIALQCPQSNNYHIQSETVLVEILDEQDRPCQPGQVGRVIVTPLHNFALPLIRYEVGDYAEVGESCPCGRGLPTLRQIMGRRRNMATTPDGKQFWPSFPAELWTTVAPIRQIQLLQHTTNTIEVCYVLERPLLVSETKQLKEKLLNSLGYPFNLTFTHRDSLLRPQNGKYEDFISLLPS